MGDLELRYRSQNVCDAESWFTLVLNAWRASSTGVMVTGLQNVAFKEELSGITALVATPVESDSSIEMSSVASSSLYM
jgi:hypothetical protein